MQKEGSGAQDKAHRPPFCASVENTCTYMFVGCLIAKMLGGTIPVNLIYISLATLSGALEFYVLQKNVADAPYGRGR